MHPIRYGELGHVNFLSQISYAERLHRMPVPLHHENTKHPTSNRKDIELS